MEDKVGWAQTYISEGLSVLPVAPQDKRPMLRSWEKYSQERPDPELVRTWFETLTSAGIGAVTGAISGVVVVDIDTRSGLNYETITKDYPTDRIARTPSGGFHLYYRHPGHPVKNRVNLTPGVDIRADGGFVVLPPTVSASGAPYQWIARGEPGEYPEGLVQTETDEGTSEGDRWVSEALRGVREGGRNEAASRLAGYFFAKAMPIDIVFSVLREWNEKNDPPMELKELETTIQSVHRLHARAAIGPGKSTKTKRTDLDASASFDLVSMTDYFREYGQEGVQWAVQEWLPDKTIVFLVSPPESYKTWILLDLAVSVSSGLPFLGSYAVANKGPVIIIQQEDSHAGLTERLSVIMQGKMGLKAQLGQGGEDAEMPILPDLPIFIHPSRNLRFDNEKVMDELEEAIRQIRPVCVIIDPLYSATSTDNYMADAAEDMFRLKKFRDEYGCSFIIAHHSRKNTDPDSTAREDGWGSQFLNAFLETGWQVRRSPKLAENEVVVRRHSKTTGNLGMISLQFDIHTHYPMGYAVQTRPYSPTSGRAPAQGQIYELISEGPMTLTEIVEKTGKHKSTISRQLKQLETTNSIRKMPDGKYKVNEEES